MKHMTQHRDIDGNIIYDELSILPVEEVRSRKIEQIKAHAGMLIVAIEGSDRYRVLRAEQRAVSNHEDTTERDSIYLEIDTVRKLSDDAEALVNATDDKNDVWEFDVEGYFQ